MHNNLLIYIVRDMKSKRAPLDGAVHPEQKGNIMIRDLWERGTDCIIYTRVFSMDVLSYMKKTPEKILVN